LIASDCAQRLERRTRGVFEVARVERKTDDDSCAMCDGCLAH